ncbi:hypothetical protein H9Q70_000046 [Fusarium xylarioides]|nr:hypothetical protein H9Q70_000046 [Fusarium xylarioides]KAG5785962.1 hypothetical protein H9Q73_000400 [Fusarium xylarioides]
MPSNATNFTATATPGGAFAGVASNGFVIHQFAMQAMQQSGAASVVVQLSAQGPDFFSLLPSSPQLSTGFPVIYALLFNHHTHYRYHAHKCEQQQMRAGAAGRHGRFTHSG